MDWTYNTIWYDQLSDGEYFHVLFDGNEKKWNAPSGGFYYVIEDFKPKSKEVSELRGIGSPKYMELNRSNITSFSGIQSFSGLKRLELHYCVKLASDLGIGALHDDLEWLHVNTSRKFSITDELQSLSKLKVLCLNDCAPIDSLDFIHSFPDLIDLRFVGTDILDGNTKQLKDCKSLLNVAFSNKRHFNCKFEEMSSYFQEKSKLEKSYVSKGDFITFKYNAFKK